MEQLNVEEIIRQNPHLSMTDLEEARELHQKLRPRHGRGRYRLVPIGYRRVTIGENDQTDSRTVYLGRRHSLP